MISDLHIGDGSRGDNLVLRGREELLWRFLDHVEAAGGRLVICGDLLELWRFRLEGILARHWKLLERLGDMGAIFVLGNHDAQLGEAGLDGELVSAFGGFFSRRREKLRMRVGERVFQFMHGHEVDPFIPERPTGFGKILGTFTGWLEFGEAGCIVSNDAVSDCLLEAGENLLSVWYWAGRKMRRAMRDACSLIDNEELAKLRRPLRTRRMLSRYYEDMQHKLYDVAIVGHTHRAGRFGGWYFNSGSWTGASNNFLQINPDGGIEVFDWTSEGAVVRQGGGM